MTVRELITYLQRFDDRTPVLTPDGDQTYRPVLAPEKTTALLDADGGWLVDAGEVVMPEAEFGVRVDVALLI